MGRKHITSLTKAEEAQMRPWAEKYTALGLSTERADRARVERGIHASYAFAGLPTPKRVWVQSLPVMVVAGATASWLLASDAAVGDAVGGAVDAAVGAVDDAVRVAVGAAVHDAVGDAVGAVDDAVRVAVGAAVHGAVGDAVGAVDDAVRVAVGDAVGGAVDAAVGAVDAAVCGAVGGAVGDAVGAVGAAVGGVGAAVHDAVGGVGDAVRVAVGDAVEVAVDAAVRGAVDDAKRALLKHIRQHWHRYVGGRWWLGYWWSGSPANASFYREVLHLNSPQLDTWDRAQAYEDLLSGGQAWLHKDYAICCEPPTRIEREEPRGDAVRRLHCTTGPAIQWADGVSIWFVRGVQVPREVVEDPRSIPVERILTERNAEVRRVMIEQYGAAALLKAAGATTIDQIGSSLTHEALYRLDLDGDEAIVMLEVVNQSPEPIGYEPESPDQCVLDGNRWYKRYWLRVPPSMRTAHEARAWTFGVEPEQFAPLVET